MRHLGYWPWKILHPSNVGRKGAFIQVESTKYQNDCAEDANRWSGQRRRFDEQQSEERSDAERDDGADESDGHRHLGSISSTWLSSAFTSANHKSPKNTAKPSVYIALLGSVCIKAARKMLVKLTPGVIFINMLMSSFSVFQMLWHLLLFHQQYYDQLYQYSQLEVTSNFYTVQCVPVRSISM